MCNIVLLTPKGSRTLLAKEVDGYHKKRRLNVPPTRWTLTAPHSWVFPHTVVHSIHGLEIHFKCTARFFYKIKRKSFRLRQLVYIKL